MSNKVKGGDAFHRMNFLYQVATVLQEHQSTPSRLVSFYGHALHMISRRIQAKLDPSIKRTLCKKCSTLLSPGVTCTERLRGGKGKKHLTVTCLVCGTVKRFPTKRGYQLWYDSAKARENPTAAVPAPKVQHPPDNKA
ncbi:unnamed protein product [Ixodes hexagonus]